MPKLRIAALTAVALTAVAGPASAQEPSAPVTGRVIMDGSWEGAINPRRGGGLPADWRGLQTRPGGRKPCFELDCSRYALRIVQQPVTEGEKAGRFEVRDRDNPFGDAERSEVQGPPTGPQGSGRWYSWSTYLPANFRHRGIGRERYLAITQWAVPRGVPPLAIYVDRGHLALGVNESTRPRRQSGSYRPWGAPIGGFLGRWVDIDVYVKWSTQRNGQVQLWVDGVQQQMNWPFGGEGADPARYGGVGGQVFTGRTLVPGGGRTYVKQGIVRSKALSGRSVVTHDGLKVRATTRVPVPAGPSPAPVPEAPAPVLPAS